MTNKPEHATYIGPANSELVVGFNWRRTRELAVRLGVRRVRAGKSLLIPLAEFRAALEAANECPAPGDDAESVREALRQRRAAG